MYVDKIIEKLEEIKKEHGNIDCWMEHSSEYHSCDRKTTISEIQFRIDGYPDAPTPFEAIIICGG